ncbi:hypothetical protein [Novosphingobium sp. Rr 2-17]|uniref:hypothetical protein n=1 Tax=Novosphingobium sp. Rr 2-17 TaxID=555793 RepID=UPI000308D865|nr:hypothetical protein [Novosphingobium sp. Rr 2-17]
MKRRTILLSVVGVLLMVNAGYFWWSSRFSDQSSFAQWVIYMPELEASQRLHPTNFLATSDSHDARYNVWDNGGSTPVHLLVRAALICKAKGWTLATYPFGTANPTSDQPVQMPDRLYLVELDKPQRACLRRSLPKGYALAQLKKPVVATGIGWGSDDLQLMPQSAARKAQAD